MSASQHLFLGRKAVPKEENTGRPPRTGVQNKLSRKLDQNGKFGNIPSGAFIIMQASNSVSGSLQI